MGGSSLVYGTVLKVPVLPLLKGQRENRGHYITGLYSNGHEGRRVRFEVPCLCLFFLFFFRKSLFGHRERGKVRSWEGATFRTSCSQLFCITFHALSLLILPFSEYCLHLFLFIIFIRINFKLSKTTYTVRENGSAEPSFVTSQPGCRRLKSSFHDSF